MSLNRRDLLKLAALTLGGSVTGATGVPLRMPAAGKTNPTGSARNVLLIHLNGGMSQADCWDFKETKFTPKDLEPQQIRSDLVLSKTLFPELIDSRILNRVSFVRSMRTDAMIHALGYYEVQTGRPLNPALVLETPAMGSVIASELESQRRARDLFPTYVAVSATASILGRGAIGCGFLPACFSPWNIDSGAAFAAFKKDPGGNGDPILEDPRCRALFQLTDHDRRRYGIASDANADSYVLDDFALSAVLSRNILKADAGARFLYLSRVQDVWDMHERMYDRTNDHNLYRQCLEWDRAFTSLLEDLDSAPGRESGKSLLDETLIVCTSEFGRAPAMNANFGRDHHGSVFTSLFAGGGIKRGRVIGRTNEDASMCVDTGWRHRQQPGIHNLAATIYSALGIDWKKTLGHTPSGHNYEYVASSPRDPLDELFV